MIAEVNVDGRAAIRVIESSRGEAAGRFRNAKFSDDDIRHSNQFGYFHSHLHLPAPCWRGRSVGVFGGDDNYPKTDRYS